MQISRYLLYALFLSMLLAACTEQAQIANPETELEGEQRPADWLFRQRAYPSGEIDGEAYKRALKDRAFQLANATNSEAKDLTTTPWEFAGPINVGGRVTDVERLADGTILVGAASGGVFRTTDEGASWDALFDEQASLAIGDIAPAPSNQAILYVGTGEANAGGGSIAYDGLGVFRSDDGGDTWASRGLEDVGSIGRVLVDPNDPDRVYVAAMGTLFANNSERGVYRTLDGGNNWEQVLFLSDSTGAIDLAMHPSDPDVLYAAMWERIRRPDRRQYTGSTSGVYKSTDGGTTWQELGNGLPTAPDDKGRISLAIAPSDPDRVYAGFVNAGGFLANMMISDDAGGNWSNLPLTDLGIVPYDWWFNRVVVHPADPDRLYYIGFNINEYLPNEGRWTLAFNGVHVDQHSLWIDPDDPNAMLLGNDGGLYFSSDGGQNYTKSLNLPITQFYTCEIDYQEPDRLYGGTQDNGTNRTLTGALDDWSRIYGGDGFRVLVDPTDNTYVYAAFQYGNIARSTNGGASFVSATGDLSGSRRNWYTPYVLDPTDPSRLYLGAERVYLSTNRAENWTPISPDLTNGNQGTNGLVYGTITALSVSPPNPSLLWVGTDDGNVWMSPNGGTDWESVSDNLPQRWVTSITADPNISGTAYVTFSGYRFGTNMSHVYKTQDFGATWENLNGNLPDVPVNDLVVHPDDNTLFLATDVGVYFSTDGGEEWNLLGTEIPAVIVTDLTLHLPTNTLVAATFGRSMWKINLDVDVGTNDLPELAIDWSVAPNPVRSTATVRTRIATPGQYRLTAVNAAGQTVQTLHDGTLAAGEHTITWSPTQLPAGSYWLVWERAGLRSTQAVVVSK